MRRIHHRTANLIFGIGLLLLILMQFWFPILDPGNNNDTRSTSISGKKAFYLLMESQGFSIYRSDDMLVSTIDQLDYNETLVMLGPARLPKSYHWESILDWVRSGGTLLVAASYDDPNLTIPEVGISVVADDSPKEKDKEDNSSDEESSTSGTSAEEEEDKKPVKKVIRFCKSFDSPIYKSDKIAWARGASLQLEGHAANYGTTLARSETGIQATEVRLNRGRVIVLANDALFTNQSMMNQENAILAVKLLKHSTNENNYYGTICVEEWLSTTAVPKVVGLLLTPPFRNLTLLTLALLWIFAWWKWFRFGPYLPEEESHRLNIVSHTDTVGTLYFQERLGRHALEAYWKQLQKDLNWTAHKQHRTRVISRLARRTGWSEEDISKLIYQALDSIENPNLMRTDAAHLIRELAKLRAAVSA
ncbi:MAG: DUF4350 domain-containing protein [Planctomycetaceae bacterium]|nr:DUF4350 domain-containing protein [Planctomycetaceae bacterium]